MRQHLTRTPLVAVSHSVISAFLFPSLPEQTGERMRGGAVAAAVAASTGAR